MPTSRSVQQPYPPPACTRRRPHLSLAHALIYRLPIYAGAAPGVEGGEEQGKNSHAARAARLRGPRIRLSSADEAERAVHGQPLK